MKVTIKIKQLTMFALILLMCAGAVIRFYQIGAKEFSFTELNIVKVLPLPLGEMIKHRLAFGHIPLYSLTLKAIAVTAGLSEGAFRAVSAGCGVLAIYLTFLIGKALFNVNIALIATTLFAFSRNQLFYSQWVRSNMACLLFVLLSILFFIQALKTNKNSNWAGYVGARSIALCLHSFAGFMILVELAYLAFFCRGRERSLKFFAGLGGILLLLSPFVLYFLFHLKEYVNNYYTLIASVDMPVAEPVTLKEFFLSMGRSFFRINNASVRIFLYPVFCLLGIAGVIMNRNRRDMSCSKFDGGMFVILWLVLPVATLYSASSALSGRLNSGYSFFDNSYLLPVECAYLLLIANGGYFIAGKISRCVNANKSGLKAFFVLMGMVFLLSGRTGEINDFYLKKNPEWKKAIGYVIENQESSDHLMVFPSYARFLLSFYDDRLRLELNGKTGFKEASLSAGENLWLVVDPGQLTLSPENNESFSARFTILGKKEFYKINVYQLKALGSIPDLRMDTLLTGQEESANADNT